MAEFLLLCLAFCVVCFAVFAGLQFFFGDE
jgi:hypothetical protein